MEFEDLRDVVLVGHSYGGVVATGVADRLADRIAAVVYLDAFVPESGQCAFDLVPPAARAQMEEAARREGDGWRVPPSPLPPDTPAEDRAWAAPRRMPQPIGTLREPLELSGRTLPPRAYIYCTRCGPGDAFRPYAERARQAGWPTFELDASHNPHITCPGELFALLQRFA
jgi:pimeloyl-ACP methyl ester carboxylesterase